MTKSKRIIASIVLMFIGWLMVGIGFTELKAPYNTIFFLLGLICTGLGFTWILIAMTSKNK